MKYPSAEQWCAELDDVLSRYRPEYGETRAPEGMLNLTDAIAALRRLGFSSGEALLELRKKSTRDRRR